MLKMDAFFIDYSHLSASIIIFSPLGDETFVSSTGNKMIKLGSLAPENICMGTSKEVSSRL